mmetsp:Transcript_19939/g.37039  ORF Transcript_19939/g.37039 Transcript_19939/m.37039 type:complete len:381 (+) Transcript_19939:3-1145(+)
METFGDQGFAVVHAHENLTDTDGKYTAWLSSLYKAMPAKSFSKLAKIFMYIPSSSMMTRMWLLKPFAASRLWRKLDYIQNAAKLLEKTGLPSEAVAQGSSPEEQDDGTSSLTGKSRLSYFLPTNLLGAGWRGGPGSATATEKSEPHKTASSTESSTKEATPPYDDGLYFGKSLEQACANNDVVPIVVQDSVEFLMRNGIAEVGLFRVPGEDTVVNALKEQYDHGGRPLRPSLRNKDTSVAAVSSLLKAYFRELPEPVIPLKVYQQVVKLSAAEKDSSTFAFQLSDRFVAMEPHRVNTLGYLAHFLAKVAEHAEGDEGSKMDAQNLAIVWGPNLFSSRSSENTAQHLAREMTEFPHLIRAIKCMITQAQVVFPPELLGILP